MQTALADFIRDTPEGQEAQSILQACVHCGFCNATCPTYGLLGSELDGPRGRIYLLKMLLEGQEISGRTQLHLDRCLTCRACETTCPSGVRYGRLADIGRVLVEERVGRPPIERLKRLALRRILPYPARFGALLAVARWLRPLLPGCLRRRVPPPHPVAAGWPERVHPRRMLLLEVCVQPALVPAIDVAAARVLDRLGISLVRVAGGGCCGAVSYHLSAREEALGFMRRNIDAWWPELERGAEAIVSTASGCGAMLKEYADALRHDPAYAEKAARISGLARDLGEVLAAEDLSALQPATPPGKVAFQSPCTLQHGQKLNGVVEGILTQLGFELTPVANAHLCCGAAGTYSLLQADLAGQLLEQKLATLAAGGPEVIATANIGCLTHLESRSHVPVRHWVELL